MTAQKAGERNLALYPIYVCCLNAFFWFPIFFIYLTERVGLDGALRLEAMYYLAVVIFEVPSGWFSDKFGRRPSLRLSAFLLGAAYAVFALSETAAGLATAQVCLAAGFAFNSGTDTSFHYDSLVAVGREDEYEKREEKIARLSFATVGVSGLVGGVLAAWELHYAYIASAAAMVVGLVVTLAFQPPEAANRENAERFDRQVMACVRDVRGDPTLRWLFGAWILLTVAIHVPYQLYQPYLDAMGLQWGPDELASTPIITGVHAFAAMIAATLITSRSTWLAARIGLRRTVIAALGFGTGLIALIAVALHPVIALLLVFRSASRALIQAPVNAAIAPRVPSHRRASYFSMQSLAGRLAFSGLLGCLALVVGDGTSYEQIALSATIAAATCGVAWVLLVVTHTATDAPAGAVDDPAH